MIRQWLGQSYHTIDATRLGDGQDDTLPVSAALCRAIYSNIQWLATEPRTVSWSPIIAQAAVDDDVAGTRPYAFRNEWLSVLRIRVRLEANAQKLQIWGAWYALTASASFGGNDDETPVRVRVWMEGVVKQVWELEQTRDAGWTGQQLGRDVLELELGRPPAGEYVLDVAMRSDPGLTTYDGASSNVILAGTTIEDNNSTGSIFVDQTSGNPDDQSLEVMVADAGYAETAEHDLVGTIDRAGKSSGATAGHVHQDTQISHANNSVNLVELSFLAPRAVAMRIVYDREAAGRILPAELRPNILVTGGATTRLAQAAVNVLTRPRLLAVGPRGTLDSGDTGYTSRDYRRGWPEVWGDDSETALWSEQVFLTSANPTLQIRQWVTCLSLDTLANESGPSVKGGKRPTVDGPGRAGWDFRVVVDRLDDVAAGGADWSTDTTEVGEDSATRVLGLTAAHVIAGGPPIARTMSHLFDGQYSNFAYREGQLVVDGGDYDALQELSIEVDLSGLAEEDLDRPYRVTLYAQHDTAHAENDYMKLSDASPTIGPEGWLKIISHQHSVTEVPTPSEVLGDLNLAEFLSGRRIDVADWEALRAALRAHWERTGAVMSGPIFDPPWETTSATYTTTDEGSGGIDLDTWAGAFAFQRLIPGDEVGAAAKITFTGNAADGETVEVAGKTYTWQTTLTDVDGHVLVGADAAESIDNLVAAIFLGSGAGTVYAASTTEHPEIEQTFTTAGPDTLTVQAGYDDNDLACSETMTNASWNYTELRGGSRGTYELELTAYLQDCDLQFTLLRFDGRATLSAFDTVTVSSSSGDAELVTETLEIDEAEAYENDVVTFDADGVPEQDPALFYVHVQGRENGAGTGYVWLPCGRENPHQDADQGLGTSGYTKLWTDTSESGGGMYRIATDPHDNSHFLVGSSTEGGSSPERLVLMGADGAAEWSRDTSSTYSAANAPSFLDDGDVVFAGNLADGGYGTARAMVFDGASGADGTMSPTDPSSSPKECRAIPGTDRVWFDDSSDLYLWDISANSFVVNGSTTISDLAIGSMCALSDESTIVVDNQNDELVRVDSSGSEVWRESLETSGGGSSLRVSAQSKGANTTHLEEAAGHVYVSCIGTSGVLNGDKHVVRFDISDGLNGTVMSPELDALSGASGAIYSIRRDSLGGWWIVDRTSGVWDILRFESDWTFIHSIKTAFSGSPMFTDHGSVHDVAILDTKLILMSGSGPRLSGYSID